VAAMQRLASNWRRNGISAGLVPTMGYLHAGHLSLVKHARRAVGKNGRVALSIYVNPTQFSPTEDFSRYPRDLRRDLKLCRAEGVDVVFVPADKDMYPAALGAAFSTYVVEEKLSSGMEGASRPTHFRGVTTIVAKLFNIVQPEVAVFGAKDYQQAAVIKRMARDLNFPVRIIVAPTVREADGLAMSSRNKYLEGELRESALILSHALKDIRDLVRSKPLAASRLKQYVKSRVNKTPGARLDYVEFFDAETLEPARTVKRGTHTALAVFVGRTRLIDNKRL
jgi:pantoate--beta-alanine ligase